MSTLIACSKLRRLVGGCFLITHVAAGQSGVWNSTGAEGLQSNRAAPIGAAAQPSYEKEHPFTNTLGMTFVPVLRTNVLFCIWETRVQDYDQFVRLTGRTWPKPAFEQEPSHPAVMVSFKDATAFCCWLTAKEQTQGLIATNMSYRLPTDLEWSRAVGLEHEVGLDPMFRNCGVRGKYPWGEDWPPQPGAGNYAQSLKVDAYEFTSPVGNARANAYGLYDMGGNVLEWCADEFSKGMGFWVLRGGHYRTVDPVNALSSCRFLLPPSKYGDDVGFRCVLAPNTQSDRAGADGND